MGLNVTKKQSSLLIVSLITLIAYLLRAYHIDHFSFWIDEALTALRTGQSVADILAGRTYLQGHLSYDTHPPLYYLVVYVTRNLWGETDFAYRYVSLLFGVLLVPVTYQLGKKLYAKEAGWVGAFFVAINPLFIWYGQEARMYTMLVFWGSLSSYFLLCALQRGSRPMSNPFLRRTIGGYALFAALAMYTHYTAVFLIGGQALLWIWVLWQQRYYRLIGSMLVLGVLATIPAGLLAYHRLSVSVFEAGYRDLSILTVLESGFGGFAFGFTATPISWLNTALWFSYLALIALTILSISRNKQWQKGFFLFAYISFPVIGILLGSLLQPMYQNARHIMLGSPAFSLILAGGWFYLAKAKYVQLRLITPLALLLVVIGSASSLEQFYWNPEQQKDQLRELVAHIEKRAGTNDVVIYHDPILMLAHLHYATRDDVEVTAKPSFGVRYDDAVRPANELNALMNGRDRLWFIPAPPATIQDPNNETIGWVQTNLNQLSSHHVYGRGTNLYVSLHTPENIHDRTVSYQWGETSLSMDHIETIDQTDDTIWLATSWTGSQNVPQNTQLIFSLQGEDGKSWLEQSESFGYMSDTPEVLSLQHGLDLPTGLPTGDYDLWIQLWDKDAEQAIGEKQNVLSMAIAPQRASPMSAMVSFDNGLSLLDVLLPTDGVRPGHIIVVDTVWQATEPLTGLSRLLYDVQLFDENDALILEKSQPVGASWLDTLSAGELTRNSMVLTIPPALDGGSYRLSLRLRHDTDSIAGSSHILSIGNEWHSIASFQIEAWPFITELPPLDYSFNGRIENFANLTSFNLNQSNTNLEVNLVWQILEKPNENYFVFLHLRKKSDNSLVSQTDWLPLNGARPTIGWRPEELLLDTYNLDLTNVPSGEYDLYIGMYNPDSLLRPSAYIDGVQQQDNQIKLHSIDLP